MYTYLSVSMVNYTIHIFSTNKSQIRSGAIIVHIFMVKRLWP